MANKRDDILRKIAALRAKTEEAGATEAEAMMAAEKAAELMADYEIAEADLAAHGDREKPKMGRKFADCGNGTEFHSARFCGAAIAKLTQTSCIGTGNSGGRFKGLAVAFIGDRPDVEFATFLFDTVRRAMNAEYAAYRAANRRVGHGAKKSFQLGMATRINERLLELVAARQNNRTSDCRALVVTKKHEVAAATHSFYPRIRNSRSSRGASNGGAYGAGKEAGNGVGFGRPIGGGSSGPSMIAAS